MQSWGDQLISADNYAHQNIKPVNGYICFFTAASRIDYLFLVPHLAKYQKGRSFYRSHIKKNKCFGLYFERGICVIHLLLTSIKLILSSAVKTFCFHDFKPFLFVWKINGIKFCHAFRTVSSLKKKKKVIIQCIAVCPPGTYLLNYPLISCSSASGMCENLAELLEILAKLRWLK